MDPIHKPPFKPISRRAFLGWLASAGAAGLITACHTAKALPPAAPPAVPTLPGPTRTPFLPGPTMTPTRMPATATPTWLARVGITRVNGYDPALIRTGLEAMLADLGGPGDWIKPGARVGIKVNLTGTPGADRPGAPKATEYFVTHPAVVAALAGILKDSGADRIYVMDGLGDPAIFERWGYTELLKPLGVQLVDLCKPAPFPGYKIFPVRGTPRVYEKFYLNGMLAEMDGLISAAKLKCHATTGVTLSLKNLIGLAPIEEYRLHPLDNNRSAFHGAAAYDTRLPGVIMDLNRAVPVRLALVDGIMTAEGGAGPWETTLSPVSPGLLLAGKDPVAVDTVATAVMGFDPSAPGGSLPFLHGENYLETAAQLGLGAHRLGEIGVSGLTIQEARFPFKPAP